MSVRRTIERITYYDHPGKIYDSLINGQGWDYRYNKPSFKIRDMALITALYVATARITEMVGGPVQITVSAEDLDLVSGQILSMEPIEAEGPEGEKIEAYKTKQILDPVTRDQFIMEDKEIWLRDLPIVKQKFIKRGNRWVPILMPRDYPLRVEIPFFKEEDPIRPFTEILASHLETIPEGAPVWNMTRNRAYQIIAEYGQFPHYYRDMGLKWWKRYFKNDSFKLKKFSGHKRWSSLEKYMGEELF